MMSAKTDSTLFYQLHYEPRALYQHDDACYIGSKDGQVTRFEFRFGNWHPNSAQFFKGEAVKAIEGEADTKDLYIGLSGGNVYRLDATLNSKPTPIYEAAKGDTPITDLTLTGGRVWILRRTHISVHSAREEPMSLPLPHAASWMFKQTNESVLVVCDNGVLLTVVRKPKELRITDKRQELSRLPLLVERVPHSTQSKGSKRPELLVGHHDGMDIDDGSMKSTEHTFSGRPTMMRIVELFGKVNIVVAVEGGKLFAAPLRAHARMRRWERWHQFSSDVLAFVMPPNKSDDAEALALVVLRTHEVHTLWVKNHTKDQGAGARLLLTSPNDAAAALRTMILDANRESDLALVRRAARTFRDRVLMSSRKATTSEWIPLVRLLRAVDNYSEGSAAYFEKERRLSLIVAANEDKRPLDALVYASRLAERRYDVIDDIEVDSSIKTIVVLESGTIVAALETGRYRVVALDEHKVLRAGSPFGSEDRTNVLVRHGGELHAWPPKATNEAPVPFVQHDVVLHEHVAPTFESRESEVYAATRIDGDAPGWALGLHTDKGPVIAIGTHRYLLEEPTATAASGIGARRVRVLLTVADDCLVAGTDDGAIYVVPVGAAAASLRPAVSVGSAVCCGAIASPDADGGSHLCVGTASGDILIWSIETRKADNKKARLRLRARDHLFGAITALFVVQLAGQQVMLAATVDGAVAAYAIPRRATTDEDLRRYPLLDGASGRLPFPCMRLLHIHAVQGRVAAAVHMPTATGVGLVIAYGAHADRAHRIRTLELIPRDASRIDDLVRRAEDDVKTWFKPIGIEDLSLPELLSALPFPGSAVRALAARIRIGRMQESKDLQQRLEVELRAALRRHSGQRAEFKSILDAVREHMQGEKKDWTGIAWFRAAFEALMSLQDYDERCKAAAVRKLLCPTALLARADGAEERLEQGLNALLEGSSPLVQLETLQAMADTLHLIRKERLTEQCFPGDGGEQVVAAATFLRPIARFIASARPSVMQGSQVSPQFWTALVVIRHLMVTLPRAVWVICDHLSVSGVSWDAMNILAELIGAPEDDGRDAAHNNVRRRFYTYIKWFPRQVITPRRAAEFLAEQSKKPLNDGSPDAVFDQARVARYRWFLAGFTSGTLAEMRKHVVSGKDATRPAKLPWLARLDHARSHFFSITLAWQKDLSRLLAMVLSEDVHDPVEAAASFLRPELLGELLEPERSIAAAMFSAWHGALLRSPLLVGDVIGSHVVTGLVPDRSPWVVEGMSIRSNGPRDAVMIRLSPVPGMSARSDRPDTPVERRNKVRSEVQERWSKIRKITESEQGGHLPRIYEVVEREWGVAMVMENAGAPIGAAHADPLEIAQLIVVGISRALLALHAENLFQGDVARRNIVRRNDLVKLVDFGHAGGPFEHHADTELSLMPYSTGQFNWWQVRRRPQRALARGMQGDVLRLAEVLVELVPKRGPESIELARAIHDGDVSDVYTRAARIDPSDPFGQLVRRTLLTPTAGSVRVFLSYTRLDPWSLKFVARAKIIGQAPGVMLFVDDMIASAEHWKNTISANLHAADIIVLCVSSHYVLRDFIVEYELPVIKQRVQDKLPARLLVLSSGVLADLSKITALFGTTKFEWPLDDPASEHSEEEQSERIDRALKRLLELCRLVAGQEQVLK